MASSDSSGSDDEDYTLMYKAANFLKKDLDALVVRFADRHNDDFGRGAAEDRRRTGGDHDLALTRLHKEFVSEMEVMLERYITSECPNMKHEEAFQRFLKEASDTLEGRFMPLFCEDEDPNRIFVDSIFAMLDFENPGGHRQCARR